MKNTDENKNNMLDGMYSDIIKTIGVVRAKDGSIVPPEDVIKAFYSAISADNERMTKDSK